MKYAINCIASEIKKPLKIKRLIQKLYDKNYEDILEGYKVDKHLIIKIELQLQLKMELKEQLNGQILMMGNGIKSH